MTTTTASYEEHQVADDVEMANEEIEKQLVTKQNVPAGLVDDMTPEEAALSRQINHKMDIAMLPMLLLLYLFNGLDKGNVGNAETQGPFRPSIISLVRLT